jgi:hypothetical protein
VPAVANNRSMSLLTFEETEVSSRPLSVSVASPSSLKSCVVIFVKKIKPSPYLHNIQNFTEKMKVIL